jgi:hypothetical protein
MSGRIIDLTVTLTNNMPAHKFSQSLSLYLTLATTIFASGILQFQAINWGAQPLSSAWSIMLALMSTPFPCA